ncbi:MAG: hypothetical protein ALECFALPRED_006189 [Alectoria fallacina]|uniref:Ubiquitin-like domain-containing protein n=1 Tax=Alectoria fallacina TaxID=1903189 RepID=A0A8H3IZD7_9LECA|nr:MAG: hypothetical protein ALECFALPRED_006189 [Alectoria fallacina]
MPVADALLFILNSLILLRYALVISWVKMIFTALTILLQAFLAVLKVRFKDIGLRKIENGQFTLEDTRRKRSLSLSDAWSTVVRPGQHISMSMIFRLQQSPQTSCPSCGQENEGSDETEIECANIACRLTYRRIVDVSSSENEQSEEDRESSSQSFSSLGITGSTSTGNRKRADSRDNSMDDDITQYTRVQISYPGILWHPLCY